MVLESHTFTFCSVSFVPVSKLSKRGDLPRGASGALTGGATPPAPPPLGLRPPPG